MCLFCRVVHTVSTVVYIWITNTLQLTATHCNTLRHAATHCRVVKTVSAVVYISYQHYVYVVHFISILCLSYRVDVDNIFSWCWAHVKIEAVSVRRLTAMHCSTMQHTTPHCSTLQQHVQLVLSTYQYWEMPSMCKSFTKTRTAFTFQRICTIFTSMWNVNIGMLSWSWANVNVE